MDNFIENHLSRIKNIQKHGLKVSINWDGEKPFEWMLEHSKFIFSHYSSGRLRISLVIDERLEGDRYDCFEIGYDKYGIQVKGCTQFGPGWGSMIVDSSKEIVPFIKDYLLKDGATDLIL